MKTIIPMSIPKIKQANIESKSSFEFDFEKLIIRINELRKRSIALSIYKRMKEFHKNLRFI